MTRSALVLGSEGFIGRHFRADLIDRGFDVTGIDIKNAPNQDVRRWLPYCDERFDLVVHAAAVVGGRQTIESEPLKLAVDYAIDADVIQFCARTSPGRLVAFSSSAAYPTVLQAPSAGAYDLKESDINPKKPLTPDAEYGQIKLTLERLTWHLRELGTKVTLVRPFSGYGEDQDLDYPFPTFIQRAERGDDPFQIWGRGDQKRDFVHVDDVVAGTMALVEKNVPGPVNLCTGIATSFNELQRIICQQVGYKPKREPIPGAPVGVYRRVGNPRLMMRYYTPRVHLKDGVRRSLESVGA